MSILQIVLAAIIVLGPLIAIHEFGHFWVARRLGVKVLTFSIGFGPALAKWRGKDGVDYQIAAIPLGLLFEANMRLASNVLTIRLREATPYGERSQYIKF